MIQSHSTDPDVAHAAGQALAIINDTLSSLAPAETFDYSGHRLKLGEYNVCTRCSSPIAEAQQASAALMKRAEEIEDDEIRSHVELAAQLFKCESEAAVIRAQLHSGLNSEPIINQLLGFQYERSINDDYNHSHHGGNR